MSTIFGAIIFITIWVILNYAVAYFSGWIKLAKIYSAKKKPEGKLFPLRSGFGHGGCLNYIISKKGLYISVTPPFNIGSPPLLLPWSDIKIYDVEGPFLGKEEILVKKMGIKLRLPSDIVNECRGELDRYLGVRVKTQDESPSDDQQNRQPPE